MSGEYFLGVIMFLNHFDCAYQLSQQFRLFDQTIFITSTNLIVMPRTQSSHQAWYSNQDFTNKGSLYYLVWCCDGSTIRQQGWVPNMWCDGCGQEWMCDCACETIFSHSCDISSPLIWDKMLCKISLTHSLPSSVRLFVRNPPLSGTTIQSSHDCKHVRLSALDPKD